MNPILRNTLAVVAGLVCGSVVNMGLIMVGVNIVPAPPGVDVTSPESLQATMHLFEPKHFLFPFLAHALGTLVGALIAALLAASRRCAMALVIGVFFLIGGTLNAWMISPPLWFTIVDLVFAYLPMAFLAGYRIAGRK
jgi:hypothetical protein